MDHFPTSTIFKASLKPFCTRTVTETKSTEVTEPNSSQHQHVREAPTTEGQFNIVPRISASDSIAIVSIEEPPTHGKGADLQVGLSVGHKCVPIKSNIIIIQTDIPSLILRKHPRFSIYQNDDS